LLKEEKMSKPVSDSATAPDLTNQGALDYGTALVRLFGPRTGSGPDGRIQVAVVDG
jgi:hypothetical protein